MTFDENQKTAIETIENPLMIVSTAGSGKTSVIVARANQIVKSGVKPYKILVVTFSKMAAQEMQERYAKLYGEAGIRFSTIHSLCYSVLARAFSITADSIIKESEKRIFFTNIHRKLLYQKVSGTPADFEEFYSDSQSYISVKAEADYQGERKTGKEKYFDMVYGEYIRYKAENKKIDFDDMILQCHKRLSESGADLQYWSSVFDYVMIDEFQDTSRIQAEIFYMLVKKNICVVGDDDQSIYGFRGADAEVFFEFMRRFPDCKKVYLDTNYRSVPGIVNTAHKVIRNNQHRLEKTIKANREAKHAVRIVKNDTDIAQIQLVLEEMEQFLSSGGKRNEMAILYRTKKEAATLISALQVQDIPFYTKDMPEDVHFSLCYKDIFAYYRLALGYGLIDDLMQIINRPKRYIKVNSLKGCAVERNELYKVLTRECSSRDADRINDTINDLFLDLRNLQSLKKPKEFLHYLENNMSYLESLQEYTDYVGGDSKVCTKEYESMKSEAGNFESMDEWYLYVTNTDYRKAFDKANGVCLSTFHSAKGLEWEKVIILSANEGVTPYKYKGKIENMEEERRLFYVAMTRAKDDLIISYVSKDARAKERSRFISEILETVNG